LSIGNLFEFGAVNATFGYLVGNRSEMYGEVQYYNFRINDTTSQFGLLLFGGGFGFSSIDINGNNYGIKPRITLFTGCLLFLNTTYTFLLPDNISRFQLGGTVVLPIPSELKGMDIGSPGG
jgi:hypothetical protein